MNIKLISEIGDEPVNVVEAKSQSEYSGDDKDEYFAGLISAAREQAESWNGRRLILAQWELALDTWPGAPVVGISALPNPYFGFWPSDAYRLLAGTRPEINAIALPAPLVSVDSVTYKDASAAVHTLTENTDYVVDTWKEPGIICPAPNASWPIVGLWPTSAIRVRFKSGMVADAVSYAAQYPGAAVPPQVKRKIKHGILMLTAEWFLNRVPLDSVRRGVQVDLPSHIQSMFTSDKLWA